MLGLPTFNSVILVAGAGHAPAKTYRRHIAPKSFAKGLGLGEKLLLFAFQKAKEINDISAIQAIVVDTLNKNAEAFYKKYGFAKIGSTHKMIISSKELFD
jgi:GNAT superfamily N-acetyltransferase